MDSERGGWAEVTHATLKAAFEDSLNLEVFDVFVKAGGRKVAVTFAHPESANKTIASQDRQVVEGFPVVPDGTYSTAYLLVSFHFSF